MAQKKVDKRRLVKGRSAQKHFKRCPNTVVGPEAQLQAEAVEEVNKLLDQHFASEAAANRTFQIQDASSSSKVRSIPCRFMSLLNQSSSYRSLRTANQNYQQLAKKNNFGQSSANLKSAIFAHKGRIDKKPPGMGALSSRVN